MYKRYLPEPAILKLQTAIPKFHQVIRQNVNFAQYIINLGLCNSTIPCIIYVLYI